MCEKCAKCYFKKKANAEKSPKNVKKENVLEKENTIKASDIAKKHTFSNLLGSVKHQGQFQVVQENFPHTVKKERNIVMDTI